MTTPTPDQIRHLDFQPRHVKGRQGAHPHQGSTIYYVHCIACGASRSIHGNIEYARIMLAQFLEERCPPQIEERSP